MIGLAPDECDGAFFVVLADAFADAAAPNSAPDDEIIALNHSRKADDRKCDNRMARENLLRLSIRGRAPPPAGARTDNYSTFRQTTSSLFLRSIRASTRL